MRNGAPAQPMCLTPTRKQRIIAVVCSDPPEGQARWTVQLVAEEAVKRRLVPRVGRLLQYHYLRPWRGKMWWCAGITRHGVEDKRAREKEVAIHSVPSFAWGAAGAAD